MVGTTKPGLRDDSDHESDMVKLTVSLNPERRTEPLKTFRKRPSRV